MTNKISLLIAATGVFLAVALSLVLNSERKNAGILGAAIEKVSYDLIGTSSASSTLTGAYTNNRKTFNTKYMTNLRLDIDYMPLSSTSTQKYVEILVEGSNDDGTTYFPMVVKNIGTTEIDLFAESVAPDSRYTDYGIPLIFPGDKTSNSTTSYRGSVDLDTIADLMRVSARESASGTGQFGKLYIRGTAHSRN